MAVQLDGYLVPYGRRLRDLDVGEYLSFVYARAVDGMNAEQRAEFDANLLPQRPSAATGKPVPSWASRALRGANRRTRQGAATPSRPPASRP